jgi:hypothetical protein
MKTKRVSNGFRSGSALVDFLAGRLGAPECWPNDCETTPNVYRVRRSEHLTCDAYGHTRPVNAAPLNESNE